jgi:SpoVK/Ycf46/Vps4 family AAA+-type ATPase
MGSIDLFDAPTILKQCCKQISIVDWESLSGFDPSLSPVLDEQQMNIHDVFVDKVASIASWNVSTISVHVFTLSEEEPELEDIHANDDENEPLTACETLPLPHSSLHSLWENLIVPEPIKRNLLSYAQTALLFSEKRVSANIISWNRVLLLHGPAGTGKTSLCRSLAHKLAIRMSDRYPMGGYLMEIHSHSLFSKWFSESGKLV